MINSLYGVYLTRRSSTPLWVLFLVSRRFTHVWSLSTTFLWGHLDPSVGPSGNSKKVSSLCNTKLLIKIWLLDFYIWPKMCSYLHIVESRFGESWFSLSPFFLFILKGKDDTGGVRTLNIMEVCIGVSG